MSDPATLLGLAIVALVGYGIGSISSGYLVGKIYRNVDLRTVGSGSTGATNTFRTLGRGAGLLVAVFDILKGALAVLFAQLNDSHPVAVKRRYPTSAPTTEASDPTDTIRVSARAMAKNATALAHAGVATKSSAPKPVATPRPPRPWSIGGQQ